MPDATIHRRRVTVLSEHGLHIRPCQLLAQAAMRYSCRAALVRDGRSVDLKSVFDIMSLAALAGTELDLETEGEDAAAALAELGELFDQGFGLGAADAVVAPPA